MYLPISFLAFGTGVTRPILTSKLTKAVKREETSSILGVNNALNSISQIITQILSGFILQFLPTKCFHSFQQLYSHSYFSYGDGHLLIRLRMKKSFYNNNKKKEELEFPC